MSNPISIEDIGAEVPNIKGREVNPDKDDPTPVVEKKPVSEHMEAILKYIPDELKERVEKIHRDELVMPGAPQDQQAYNAYINAEKLIRDARRKKEKKNFNFDGLKKQQG